MKNRPSEPVELYRVFHQGTDTPVYLPAGKGVLLEEANRLADLLKVKTEVKLVYSEGDE